MSKKQFNNRLKSLFANLDDQIVSPSEGPILEKTVPEEILEEIFTSQLPVVELPSQALPNSNHPRLSPSTRPEKISKTTSQKNAPILPREQNLIQKDIVISNPQTYPQATIAMPIHVNEMGDMLLEVVDDDSTRIWTEEERSMVMEVTAQLSLALENARLFQAAQQELSERVRAEAEILHRNEDLAMLNQIGQRLSSLTSNKEIFNILAEMTGEVLDNRNLYVCIQDKKQNRITFPVFREDGAPRIIPDRPIGHGIADFIISSRQPLLLTQDVKIKLDQLKIELPASERMPLSLLAIPIISGTHHTGALVVKDFDQENAPQFDEIHVELLSTAVAQAATALENARLFEQMQEAFKAIENRERYQAGVARSAASLSELGTQSLGEVLKYLGQATQASRVYFLKYKEENSGIWDLVDDWTSPLVAYLFDRSKIHKIPVDTFSSLLTPLHIDGWVIPRLESYGDSVSSFFKNQKILSTLILAVPGSTTIPNLLIFEQIDHQRIWLNDEVNILRVAADAIANTFIREGLLGQLRVNLDETESLYNASNRLVIAADYQEMLASVISGIKSPGLNRAVMLLFDTDNHNKITDIVVRSNWYNGFGTPPPPVGTSYPRSIFERPLLTSSHSFFEDITNVIIDEPFRQSLLKEMVISLAILPMWSGKRQIGVLLLEGEQKHIFSGRETRTLPPLVDQLTIAVENLRLFEQTQLSLAETALLYNMTNSIAQSTDPAEMVNLVAANVLPKGSDRVFLIITNLNDEGEITDGEIAGSFDTKDETSLTGTILRAEDLPLIRILNEDALVIENIDVDPLDSTSRSLFQTYNFKAACFIPLRSGGKLIGALAASAREATHFDPADLRLLRTVANGIAVAVEKQRLLRQAQRRALELLTASEIARDTTSTLSLDLLLGRIVTLLYERFKFYHVSIFLIDDTGNYAVIREASGETGQQLKSRQFRQSVGSRSVIGSVAADGEPLILNDVSISEYYAVNSLLPDTKAEIGLPLKLGSRIMGVLDIQSNVTNAFQQDDVNVLRILTDQISIAIDNARAYELSQKAIEEMREVDRVKSQFLANMSHELRTPLNSIIGFSRVIIKGIDGPINETQSQDLTAIYNSGQHLLSLINDILDLSKIEAGKMELSVSELNISDMVNSAMSTAIGLVKDKPIKLVTDVPKDLPSPRADSTRVRQVLINFLSNAAKFTDEGTISVVARCMNGPEGIQEILITVTDTGPGIALEDQNKLFLPFSQVDDSPTRKTGGTGLGLSICRSLVEMHNGRIGLLSSEVGKGSTFFFTLPLPYTKPSENTETNHPDNLVLAIDDDAQVISLYERFLNPQGYKVVPHTNPHTAVERAREVKPFAITLDIMMPGKDGWQVMQALKNDPETRNIPIVICSILEEEDKGFSLGAANYLVKPFLQEDLLNGLRSINPDGRIHEILVIDDDPADLRLVKKMVEEDKRFHVELAEGGKRGWNTIQQNIPDAIILDLFMPDMDGFQILTNLRSDPRYISVPVIILTGADLSVEQHNKMAEFGQTLLTKGLLREKELLSSLEDALRKYHTLQTP